MQDWLRRNGGGEDGTNPRDEGRGDEMLAGEVAGPRARSSAWAGCISSVDQRAMRSRNNDRRALSK